MFAVGIIIIIILVNQTQLEKNRGPKPVTKPKGQTPKAETQPNWEEKSSSTQKQTSRNPKKLLNLKVTKSHN
jgi:hypothetical protein